MQVFGGHCEVSMRSYKRGWMTSQPYDVVDGCDLRDVEQAKSLLTFNDEKVLFQCSYLSVHPRLLPILTSPNVGILH